MKKYRKKISALFSIMLVLFLVGCSKEIVRVKAPTAEEALSLFNKYNVDNNIEEMVKLYSDVYVDAIGYSTNQIIKIMKNNRKDVEINSATIESLEAVDDNTQKANVSITAIVNGEESTESYTYAVLKEGDGWAVSPDGIIGCMNFDVPVSKSKELNLNLVKEIINFTGGIIRVDVVNNSSNDVIFGTNDAKTEVLVETTEGTYKNTLEQSATVNKRSRSSFMSSIDGIKGEIQKVTVTNIYDADKDGNAIDTTKRDIIVYSK
ncbi:MAG: hypothetical protein E7G24_05795 [Clostridium celatum]|nr:hypothetical protein [Clostridium celatum]